MIVVEHVEKYYRLNDGRRHYVYRDLSFSVPSGKNVGVLGRNGAGKSTLIALLAGTDAPSKGRVEVDGLVSPPLGLQSNLLPALSGRENAKFICRLRGDDEERMRARLRYIDEFSELGPFFGEPLKTYSAGMKARLSLAISMAYHYDYFLIDELTAVGDEKFRRRIDGAFNALRGSSCFVLVSHSMQTLRDWCDVGVYLKNGQAYYFEDLDEAIKAYMQDNR